jgi:hypothetical protein
MNSLVETYKNAVSGIEKFTSEIQPIAERFFDFIQKADIEGYLDVSLPEVSSKNWLPLKSYKMKLLGDAATMNGVYFEAEDWDYDERITYHFVIPYDYIENPASWQIAFVNRVAREKQSAIDAFRKMFPEKKQERPTDELRITVYPADLLLNEDYLVYNASFTANGYYFEYQGFTYNSTNLYYRISTGEIFLIRDYIDRIKLLEGKTYPPLLKPLTPELRDAQMEAEQENIQRERTALDKRTLVNFADRAARKRQSNR